MIPYLDERLDKQTLEYQDYIKNVIQIDGDRSGLDVIVNTLKKRFSPYCSVATWYLWRSIDPEPIQY